MESLGASGSGYFPGDDQQPIQGFNHPLSPLIPSAPVKAGPRPNFVYPGAVGGGGSGGGATTADGFTPVFIPNNRDKSQGGQQQLQFNQLSASEQLKLLIQQRKQQQQQQQQQKPAFPGLDATIRYQQENGDDSSPTLPSVEHIYDLLHENANKMPADFVYEYEDAPAVAVAEAPPAGLPEKTLFSRSTPRPKLTLDFDSGYC